MGRFHDAVARSFAAFHTDAPIQARDAVGGFRAAIQGQRIHWPVGIGDHVDSVILADQDGHLGAGLALRCGRLGGIEKLLDMLGEQAHWNTYRYRDGEFEPKMREPAWRTPLGVPRRHFCRRMAGVHKARVHMSVNAARRSAQCHLVLPKLRIASEWWADPSASFSCLGAGPPWTPISTSTINVIQAKPADQGGHPT
jgi:hypothetical protein